jgi:hypothetical protein
MYGLLILSFSMWIIAELERYYAKTNLGQVRIPQLHLVERVQNVLPSPTPQIIPNQNLNTTFEVLFFVQYGGGGATHCSGRVCYWSRETA